MDEIRIGEDIIYQYLASVEVQNWTQTDWWFKEIRIYCSILSAKGIL